MSSVSSSCQAAFSVAAAQLADEKGHQPVGCATVPSDVGEPSVIDESLFHKTVRLLALRVPAPLCSRIMSALRPTSLLFTHNKLPTVVDEPSADESSLQATSGRPHTKLVLLSSALDSSAALPAPLASLVAEHSLSTTHHAVQLTYQLHSLDEVLRAVLPAGVTPPSSFETVGHLAHVNLLPAHLPYRRLIGSAIVSHSPGIRCVVNKLSAISDEYRVLPMEVIAGDERDTVTVVREHGCQFRFDYRLVYWNSRLATEHRRLVELIQPHETVVDMFAGIGPFVIPAAKRHTGDEQLILANDKNVHSFHALNDNIQLNGVDGRLRTFNLDAVDFIALVKQQLRVGHFPRVDHVIMNLPATAITFLHCLRGICAHRTAPTQQTQRAEEGAQKLWEQTSGQQPPAALTQSSPVVHVYAFSSADDKLADVMSRIEAAIRHPLPPPALTTDMRRANGSGAAGAAVAVSVTTAGGSSVWSSAAVDRKRKREDKQHAAQRRLQRVSWDAPLVHFVRNVAPNKDMLCVSFRLPVTVAFDTAHTDDGSSAIH